MTILKYSLATVLISVPALAQTNGTFLLTSSNTVRPSSPTTTIGIWATWFDPGEQFLFAGAGYDLTASDGEFSNPVNVLNGPGSRTGSIAGNVISDAVNGQVFLGFPPPGFPQPNLDNPVLLATYDWTATDFTPRMVGLDTSGTTHFIVANMSNANMINLIPGEFTPGSGVINVVPTPAAWLAIALPLVAGRRRRR